MSHYELVPFEDPAKLADAVAQAWISELQAIRSPQSPFCIALSGGRIARQVYTSTTSRAKAQGLDFDRVEFFWGDERCVPPADSESNFLLASELLLKPLGIPETRVHRVRGEEDPQLAATEAEAELCRIAPLDPDGQPVLDLVFLGMGEDGHVASLFPGETDSQKSSKAVYRPVTASKPPPHRITLGYRALIAAKKVWVIASAAGKEDALRKSLSADGTTPLARVLQARKETRIYTDIRI